MDLRDLGEFGLINRIRKWTVSTDSALIQGIGDDVAVIDMGKTTLLATTDILIEGIHFDRAWMDPYRLGKKSLMVNLSDVAAMGGIPKYFLITLGLPRSLPFSFFSRLYRGLKAGARQYGVDLIGGDTSLSQKITINVCLLGEGRKKDLVFRSGARAGDELFVTGTLGDSALGLEILRQGGLHGRPRYLVERHLSPSPRVALGRAIAQRRCATAMIDVSDGLLSDTRHLLEESGVGAMILEDRIPLSRSYRSHIRRYSRDPYRMALSGGEDYELLFTAPPGKAGKVLSLSRQFKVAITCIGKILPDEGKLVVIRRDGTTYKPSRLGYDHFG